MPESISLIKANPLLPAEDYVALRKQGFKYIEQTGSDIWTDYNNSDPGITILEAVCYAITDLAYRTGFEIKDLLAPEKLTTDTWKQIFYTAKQILHNTPLTINDYRKLIIDVKGVRNAWIEKSKDYEVPVWVDYNYPSEGKDTDCSCADATEKICYGKLGLDAITASTYKENFRKDELDKLTAAAANATGDEKDKIDKQIAEINKLKKQIPDDINNLIASKIVEFEGLYQVMIEYEESVVDENEKNEVRGMVVEKLAANRNLCEDFISVDAVEYENFGIGLFGVLEEYADPDVVLAQIFFTIYKYFTPSVPFYTIQQMMDKGYLVDEIFEGPPLKHGFIDDAALEKTDLFRDIRLSDIIGELADIKGVKAITYLHLPFTGINETASLKEFFNLWIKQLKDERKVARIQPSMSQITFCKERETITYYMGRKEDRRPERMLKLFKDLKTLESKYKLIGAQDDFPVPAGEYMNLEDYFPVTYSLPMCYGVGEKDNLPSNADEKRKVQALQLKGYIQFFEQILSDYLTRLNHLQDLFSFDDSIKHTAFTRYLYSVDENYNYNETELSEIRDLKTLLIDYNNHSADHWDKILKDFTHVLQNLLETPKQFNKRRNIFLNHMLARFSEDMSEYEAISKWLTPYKLEERLIADKLRMLKNGEYYKISTQRGKAYDYTKYNTWNSGNVSGAERRVSRLLGFANVTCRKLATDYIIVEAVANTPGKNIIKLLDPDNKETVLLTSVEVGDGCCTELLINQILQYADERIYFKFLNGTKQRRRNYEESMEPFWFELYDSTDEDVAVLLGNSAEFNSQKDRENAFDKLQKLLDTINGNEGMHLVEHLLLRPKLDEVLDEEGAVEPVSFLNICLDKCDLGIGLNEGAEPPVYKKLITRIAAEKCYDGMPWVLEYCKLPSSPDLDCNSILFQQAFADGSEPVKLKFRKYEQLTQRVRDLQEFGSEKINYEIVSNLEEQETPATTQYSFIIHGDKNVILAQSDFKYSKRTQKQIEEEVPGAPDDIDDAIDVLMSYFGFELDFYCDEDPCDNNEDPYSFRVTVVLPCWVKRFRDATFRNLVEKTIQTEFPAHVHTRIAWVGLQEMQRFEEVYINWLEEMAQNEMPRYEIVNPLVDKLNTLQPCTCDDDCSS